MRTLINLSLGHQESCVNNLFMCEPTYLCAEAAIHNFCISVKHVIAGYFTSHIFFIIIIIKPKSHGLQPFTLIFVKAVCYLCTCTI